MAEGTKDRIVGKVWEMILSRGFSKVTMDEIAAELGISKKTLYKSFSSKDDLVEKVVHRQLVAINRQVQQIVMSDMDYIDKLNGLFTFIGNFVSKINRQFTDDLRRTKPELWRHIDDFRRENILVNIRNILEQGIRQGMFRKDIDKDVAVLMFLTAVPGLINPDTLSSHSFSAGEAFQNMIKIFFEGVLTDDTRESYREHKITVEGLRHD